MKTKKIWANLGVKDIKRTEAFYLKLGFQPTGKATKDLIGFSFGDNDFIICFFENKRFKASLEGEIADLDQGNEIMFSLSAESKADVEQWVDDVKIAGGTIFFDPRIDKKQFYEENGYYVCVFSDPDGHKFNLFYDLNRK